MEYPQSPPVRVRWLARRLLELLAYAGLLLFIVDQYLEPSIMNSLRPFHESNVLRICERVLKLSLPFMYVWLTIFYAFFHLWLNLCAELTRFGDREFYKARGAGLGGVDVSAGTGGRTCCGGGLRSLQLQ